MDEPPSTLLKSTIPRKTIIVDPTLWEYFVYVSRLEQPTFAFQIRTSQGISNLWPEMSSSKGYHLLSIGRCDIRAQHPFLQKTLGWFICCSSRMSYTTHDAFKPRIIIPKHPLRRLANISFIPIKGNRITIWKVLQRDQVLPALSTPINPQNLLW